MCKEKHNISSVLNFLRKLDYERARQAARFMRDNARSHSLCCHCTIRVNKTHSLLSAAPFLFIFPPSPSTAMGTDSLASLQRWWLLMCHWPECRWVGKETLMCLHDWWLWFSTQTSRKRIQCSTVTPKVTLKSIYRELLWSSNTEQWACSLLSTATDPECSLQVVRKGR